MNNQDAKFYLSAYRPGGADAGHPAMAEALDQARRDPSLGAWFEREQAHDAAVSEKLQSVQPPANLRATILAGARLSQAKRAGWQWPHWIGLAAALVLLATVSALLWRPAATLNGQGRMADLADYALRDLLSGEHQGNQPRAQSALAKRLIESPPRLATGLAMTPAELRDQGCHTFTIAGREVLEICFQRDQNYHLYLVRRSDTKIDIDDEHPMLMTKRGEAALTWADSRYVYVLAGKGDGQNLLSLL